MRATKVSVGFIAFIVLFVAAVNSSVLAFNWSMSFDTLLSEFVVVRCSTRSMLVKARWASPIHTLLVLLLRVGRVRGGDGCVRSARRGTKCKASALSRALTAL